MGNFDGGRGDDLAIGAPFEHLEHDFGKIHEDSIGYGAGHVLYFSGGGGAVAVIYSNGQELSVGKGAVFLSGRPPDDIQTPPPSHGLKDKDLPEFGGSLAVGDYQGDAVADLFIGVPGYSFDGAESGAGAVEIKPGVAGIGLGFSFILLRQDLFQPEQSDAETNFTFTSDAFVEVTGERFGYAIGR